jgi:hypothetical protein
MSITHLGALILGYELFAKATGRPTWTDYAARRSVLALPVVVFAVWLVVHLLRASSEALSDEIAEAAAKEFAR